ncbi:Levansucrase [Sphingomonas paucimobilis]|nr:Levansucrase [Sphingomonas paucimobilis]
MAADGHHYIVANQAEPENGGIKGFRDPGYFRDPADGSEYLLFVGSAGWVEEAFDGVIGVARRVDGQWVLQPPLIEALDVNSELERPHIILRNGLYYCFWSTQAKRFAPGLSAPTGLYAWSRIVCRARGGWSTAPDWSRAIRTKSRCRLLLVGHRRRRCNQLRRLLGPEGRGCQQRPGPAGRHFAAPPHPGSGWQWRATG